jgi:hypothetical protein
MKVTNHNKFRLFEYQNDMTNTNFELGQVVIKKEFSQGDNPIGVVIQLHSDGDCRTDMFGNCSLNEIRIATLEEISELRPKLLNHLENLT